MFDRKLRIALQIINSQMRVIDRQARTIEHISKKKSKPILVLTTIINNQTFIMADITLTIGTIGTGNMALIDNVTGNPVAATFSNQAVGANSNPEVATFELNPANPNQVKGTAHAAGSGTIVISANGSYTDAGDGSVHTDEAFTVTKNFSVAVSPNGATFDLIML